MTFSFKNVAIISHSDSMFVYLGSLTGLVPQGGIKILLNESLFTRMVQKKKKSEHVLSKQSSPEDWGQGISTETGNGGKTVTVTCPSKENGFLESASTVSTKQEVNKLCSKEKFKYYGKKKRLYSCIHESLSRKHAPVEASLGLVGCKRWNPEES